MTIGHLLTKIRQALRGPPPYTCGACGGPAVRAADGTFVRACGHEGEIVAHLQGRVSGLSRAFGRGGSR